MRAVAVGALVLALSACSSSSSGFSPDEQKAVDSLSASFQSSQNATSGFTENADDADCIAEKLVRDIGTSSLVKYGFLTPDLTADTGAERSSIPAEDAGQIADIFLGCVDIASIMKADLNVGAMSQTAQACVDDALTDDAVRSLLVAGFTGDAAATKELQTTLLACTLAG